MVPQYVKSFHECTERDHFMNAVTDGAKDSIVSAFINRWEQATKVLSGLPGPNSS